jgi:hypothetical protein
VYFVTSKLRIDCIDLYDAAAFTSFSCVLSFLRERKRGKRRRLIWKMLITPMMMLMIELLPYL